MARTIAKLSARAVETARKPGRHSDGANLYLNVKEGGSKSWLFIYRFGGKQREMGLGELRKVPLAKARELARRAREMLGEGKDPIREKQRPNTPSFGDRADKYIETHKPGWKNEKHIAQWEMTMRVYAEPIRNKPVDQITTADVVAILEPMWIVKHDTATKVRQRIEAILESARSLGHLTGDNPAAKKTLAPLLPQVKPSENHHPALPIEELPGFIQELHNHQSISAYALEFTILTASRTGEVTGAKWNEIDDLGWICPAERMKLKKPHRVPLCPRAYEILEEMRKLNQPYIFPGLKEGRHLSNAAMSELLKGMRSGVTVHGFRSTFRDWAGEHTNFPRDVCEMALAHSIESKTEAAYRRGDLFMKRLNLMESWGRYSSGESGKILSLRERVQEARKAAS